MFVVALIALAAGAWLLDSAVQNRNPVTSVLEIVRNPGDARTIAAQSAGTGYTVERTTGTVSGTLPGVTSPDNVAGSGSANAAEHTTGTTQGAQAVGWARTQIGKPYRWGATGPESFDCSGLVQAAYKSVGVSLPRVTGQQITRGTAVSRANLQIGDLVFPDLGHVQLYSGNGMVVEAPSAGKKVREVRMWGFLTARRISQNYGIPSHNAK